MRARGIPQTEAGKCWVVSGASGEARQLAAVASFALRNERLRCRVEVLGERRRSAVYGAPLVSEHSHVTSRTRIGQGAVERFGGV